MTRRNLAIFVALVLATTVFTVLPTRAQSRVQVEFWHGLGQPLGGLLEKIDPAKVPNLKDLPPDMLYPDGHGVIVDWGAGGLVFNKEVVHLVAAGVAKAAADEGVLRSGA